MKASSISSSIPLSSSNQQSSSIKIHKGENDTTSSCSLPSYKLVINKTYSAEFPVLEITKSL